jgi:hypothetical protein
VTTVLFIVIDVRTSSSEGVFSSLTAAHPALYPIGIGGFTPRESLNVNHSRPTTEIKNACSFTALLKVHVLSQCDAYAQKELYLQPHNKEVVRSYARGYRGSLHCVLGTT